MKPQNLSILAAAALALPTMLWAAGAADANGDGMLDLTEVQAAYPDITEADFQAMDANSDGALDAEEVAAAQEAGKLPANEG